MIWAAMCVKDWVACRPSRREADLTTEATLCDCEITLRDSESTCCDSKLQLIAKVINLASDLAPPSTIEASVTYSTVFPEA